MCHFTASLYTVLSAAMQSSLGHWAGRFIFSVCVLDFGRIFHKCAISLHHSIQFSVQQCRAVWAIGRVVLFLVSVYWTLGGYSISVPFHCITLYSSQCSNAEQLRRSTRLRSMGKWGLRLSGQLQYIYRGAETGYHQKRQLSRSVCEASHTSGF